MFKSDLSDYSSLKNQYDPASIVKKYSNRKLKTEPTELQKYYSYLTKSQSVLDELNYVSERMKTENLQKQKDDFNFLEDLKNQREKQLGIDKIKNNLFEDKTPQIQTNEELEVIDLTFKPKIDNIIKNDLFDSFDEQFKPILTIKDKDPKKLYEEMTAKYMPSFDLTTPTNKKPKKTDNINKVKDVMKVSDNYVNALIEDSYKKYTPQTDLQTFNLTNTKEEKRIISQIKELEKQIDNSKRDKTKREKQEKINKLKNQLSKLNKSI